MENMRKKAAYLQGLAEGLGISREDAQGRVLLQVLDLLAEMAAGMDEMADKVASLEEFAEEINEDLGDIEEIVYGGDEPASQAEGMIEITCPHCGENVLVDYATFHDEQELPCPQCGKPLCEDDSGEEG
nr:hypothetical protein [bacterium]